MNANATQPTTNFRKPRAGQTLIIAMIVLSVLLLLGFVFLGVISHNINSANRQTKRTAANDLAEAGIRYVHSQMLTGTLGADWRGLPTPPTARVDLGANITTDPDALYTRLGSGLSYRADDPSQIDLGGPDGLGFYTRVNFSNGRALVRVRYAPSDANVFSSAPSGDLLTPGKAKSYVIIESVGRPGIVNSRDPSTLNATPAQFQNFASSTALLTALNTLHDAEKSLATSRKEIAFAGIGVIDHALYVTNKDHASRPAEIGMPTELGAVSVALAGGTYVSLPVAVPTVFGGATPMYNFGTPPTPAGNVNYGGSIYVNSDLIVHGDVQSNINISLGDEIGINGTVIPADNFAKLDLFRAEYEKTRPGFPAAWYYGFPATSTTSVPVTLTGSNLNSRGTFSTIGDSIRDGIQQVDPQGFTRSAAYLEPPTMDTRDATTGALRYQTLTQQSGSLIGSGNSGRFGHGSGIYVDNLDDFQIPQNDLERSIIGTESSLVYDWLNPNNAQQSSGWRGPFYVPLGAFVQLSPDGFTITRDAPTANTDHSFWKAPDGTPTGQPVLRYRLGYGSDKRTHVVNRFTAGIANITANLGPADYDKGPVFNGVLYFEGNARVRGVIPTDAQLTLVSGATIYIEGSIVKGVLGNDITSGYDGTAFGTMLKRPSRSSLMLMARDYVTLNTTQFFGPSQDGGYVTRSDLNTADGNFPIEAQNVGDSFTLSHEFLLDPTTGTSTNPSTWLPYDGNYLAAGTNSKLPTNLLLTQTADTSAGAGAETFLSLNVNQGLATSPYLFSLFENNNGAAAILGTTGYTEPGYTNPGYASLYGLGIDSWQRFAQFETHEFGLVGTNFTYSPATDSLTGLNSNVNGTFTLIPQETNTFTFHVNSLGQAPSGGYLLARAAVVPADVRIEASIYAQNGSFFVIPGPWFNPNPDDSRISYLSKIQEYVNNGLSQANATSAADEWRLESFGSFPESPFNGEPIDVKISIFGSVSENVTPPISQQAEWLKKWGWIPVQQGAASAGIQIPASHQLNATSPAYAPNLILSYDPTLATGRVAGFVPNNGTAGSPYLRVDDYNRPLPPMPRLPVSPTLAYFGEESF